MQTPEYGIRLRSSARTDKGRVRQNNEDSVHLWADDRFVLAIVADGMGGAAAGEEASRIAVETIHKNMVSEAYQQPGDYQQLDDANLADKLADVVRRANQNIVEKAMLVPELKGMGTTLTMAFARYRAVVMAHVGDSRAYLVDGHDGDITQLTSDHSFVQALVDSGHITPEEAEHHPMRNVLYRALGQAEDIDVDVHEHFELHIGDRLVMCSDGLTLHVQPDEIADLALQDDDPEIISDNLINLALERGGRDNVSVIVITVEADPSGLKTQASEHPSQESDLPEAEADDPTLPLNPPRVERPDTHPYAEHVSPPQRARDDFGEGRDTFLP